MKTLVFILSCLISGLLCAQSIDRSKVMYIKYDPATEILGNPGESNGFSAKENQISNPDVTLKAASGGWLYFIQDSSVTEEYVDGTWKNKTKSEYTYYPNAGSLVKSADYNWNSDENKWDISIKVETYYNSNNLIESQIKYDYQNMSSSYKQEYFYDENGRTTLFIGSRWDVINGQWKFDSKSEQTFDSRGNMITMIFYYWNNSSNSWVGEYKYEYTISDGTKKTSFAYFLKDTNDWYCDTKEEYKYDSLSNQIQTIYYSWMNPGLDTTKIVNLQYNDKGWRTLETQFSQDESTGEWINTLKREYTYLGNRQSYKYSTYYLDQTSKNWILSSTIEYIRETKFSNTEQFHLDEFTNEWYGVYKIEEVSNQNGYDSLNTSYRWDYEMKQWYGWAQTQYFYDYDGFKDQVLNLENDYIDNVAMWDTISRTTNYYSIYKTDVPKLLSYETKVYPNPANDYIVVELKDNNYLNSVFELYDINGRIVLQSKIQDGSRLPLTKLSDGIYLYTIDEGSTSTRGKIVIKH